MTELKDERQGYNLDLTDYVPEPEDGRSLRDIGQFQPPSGVQDSLLADTTTEHDKLKVGRLIAERERTDGDYAVHVRATARYKPASNEDYSDEETDSYGYVETEPISVCTLRRCTELEAGIVVHWIDVLNDADSGFSGYRDSAAKTISLLDRIYDARFPDPSDESVQSAIRPFLNNAAAAADLGGKIEFTDGLIDQIVYQLYGLTEEEIDVVEQ